MEKVVNEMIETKNIAIKGMHCAACVTRIEKTLSKIDGVKSVHVSLATERGKIVYDREKVRLSDVLAKISQIGFQANEVDNEGGFLHADDDVKQLQRSVFFSILLTIPLAWAMLAHVPFGKAYVPPLFLNPFFQLVITIPIQFVIGFPFYVRAWQAIKNGSATMDVLVVLSTSSAFFYSHYLTMTNASDASALFYETSAFIITFVLLGKLLEAKTKRKTTEALARFYGLQTKTAVKIVDGRHESVPIQAVKKGEKLFVKAGEKIPLDGVVVAGYSTVNESILTGESDPVEKKRGDFVYAGTLNQFGQLIIEVTHAYADTALSHIIRIVEDAQAKKAPVQKSVDRVTAYFVPAVIVIAVFAFFVSYLYIDPRIEYEAFKRLIAVLIVACPCALGLATPTSITVGCNRAAKEGIVFKDGTFLETLSKSTVFIFDKTGTLTRGEPVVQNMYVHQGRLDEFLKSVAALERASTHPFAKAVTEAAKKKRLRIPLAQHVIELPGYGVRGSVEGRDVIIANPTYFLNEKASFPIEIEKRVRVWQREGQTVIVVAIDGRVTGLIAFSDEMKRHAKGVIQKLNRAKKTTIILSGDHRYVVEDVAKDLGVTTFYAEMTPTEKARFVETLQRRGEIVAMVGDGVNDAPALARANVGISIGTASDIAIDSSDVSILSSQLIPLYEAFLISKKTLRNIQQNLIWAFMYNVVMIPFAAFGILSPSFAAAAMACSSLAVVFNALRLKTVPLN